MLVNVRSLGDLASSRWTNCVKLVVVRLKPLVNQQRNFSESRPKDKIMSFAPSSLPSVVVSSQPSPADSEDDTDLVQEIDTEAKRFKDFFQDYRTFDVDVGATGCFSTASINKLLDCYKPAVRKIVALLRWKNPNGTIPEDDLLQVATIALWGALQRFDATKGQVFQNFAFVRVYGSLLDELRAMDWAPRSYRRLNSAIERMSMKHRHRTGNLPTDKELADALGMTQESFQEFRRTMTSGPVLWDSGSSDAEPDTLSINGSIAECPDLALFVKQILEAAERLIVKPKHRAIFERFLLGASITELSAEWRITPARASQIVEDCRADLAPYLFPEHDFDSEPWHCARRRLLPKAGFRTGNFTTEYEPAVPKPNLIKLELDETRDRVIQDLRELRRM